MDKTVIMFTKYFPYNKGQVPGEIYLNHEIGILALKVKRVYVFALDADIGEKTSIQLPENVISFPCRRKGMAEIRMLFLYLIREILFPDKSTRAESKGLGSMRKKLLLTVFAVKSDLYLYNISENMKKLKEEIGNNCILYSYWFYTYARVAVKVKEQYLNDACIISRAHRYDLYENQGWVGYLPLRKWLFENVDFVFPCSKNGSDYLKEKYPLFSHKIFLSYLGSPDNEINKKGKEFLFVSCSRITDIKRVDIILDACIWMEKHIKEFHFTWVHLGTGKNIKKLQKKARREIKNNKVKFLGNVPNVEVIQFYQNISVDLFVNVSKSEGVPMSMIEAASFGIPILATDVGGTGEIVRNGVNGWLLSKDVSDEEIGNAIYRVSSIPENEINVFRRNSREIWKYYFNISQNLDNMFCCVQR